MNINSKEELKELIEECIRKREIEKGLELITEKANIGSIPELLIRFYEHIIKFVYNPAHQRSQWVFYNQLL